MSVIRSVTLTLVSAVLLLKPVFAADKNIDWAGLELRPVPIEELVGESLSFDIGFLWFDHLAEAHLSFAAADHPGVYRAVLEARTKGIAAWLTENRVQRYESIMELDREGRLRSLHHASHIIKGRGGKRTDLKKQYRFDHLGKQVMFKGFRDGNPVGGKSIRFEGDALPDDILTIFYNFRAGFYGPIRTGGEYRIPTLSDAGGSSVVVRILPSENRHDKISLPSGGLLGEVQVIREVFDTGGGLIFVWFDRMSRPRRGIIENVVGFGDVRGIARDE